MQFTHLAHLELPSQFLGGLDVVCLCINRFTRARMISALGKLLS